MSGTYAHPGAEMEVEFGKTSIVGMVKSHWVAFIIGRG